MIRVAYWLAVLIGIASLPLVWGAQEPPGRTDIRRLVEICQRYRQQEPVCDVTARSVLESWEAGKRPELQMKRTLRVRRAGGACVVAIDDEMAAATNEEPRYVVLGYNSRYAFKLARHSDDAPWAVVALGKKDDPVWSAVRDQVWLWHCDPGWVGPVWMSTPLAELLQHPKWRTREVREETVDGIPAFVVQFDLQTSRRDRTYGRAVLIPSRGELAIARDDGRLLRVDAEIDYSGGPRRVRQVWRYEGTPPTGVFFEQTAESLDGRAASRFTLLVTQWSRRCKDDPSIFRLSGYGLPEPEWARAERRWWVWLLGLAGVACVVLGLWVLQRRRQA